MSLFTSFLETLLDNVAHMPPGQPSWLPAKLRPLEGVRSRAKKFGAMRTKVGGPGVESGVVIHKALH